MSIDLDRFCCIVEFMMSSVVELSIWTGVEGCGFTIYSSMILRGTEALHLMKVAAHLALEAAEMTL